MPKVTQLHRHPTEHNDFWEKETVEWLNDTVVMAQDRTYGKVTTGAVVLVTDEGDVITSYAGKVKTFTLVGAFKHITNRIFEENFETEEEGD